MCPSEGEPLDRDAALSAGHTAVTGGPDGNRVQLHDTAVSTFTGVSWSPSSITPQGPGTQAQGGTRGRSPGLASRNPGFLWTGQNQASLVGRTWNETRGSGHPRATHAPSASSKPLHSGLG